MLVQTATDLFSAASAASSASSGILTLRLRYFGKPLPDFSSCLQGINRQKPTDHCRTRLSRRAVVRPLIPEVLDP